MDSKGGHSALPKKDRAMSKSKPKKVLSKSKPKKVMSKSKPKKVESQAGAQPIEAHPFRFLTRDQMRQISQHHTTSIQLLRRCVFSVQKTNGEFGTRLAAVDMFIESINSDVSRSFRISDIVRDWSLTHTERLLEERKVVEAIGVLDGVRALLP